MVRPGEPPYATQPPSSSTLSPLAPPFTVRPVRGAAPYHPYYAAAADGDLEWSGPFDAEGGGGGKAIASSWMDPSLAYDSSRLPKEERITVDHSLPLNTTLGSCSPPSGHSPTAPHSYVAHHLPSSTSSCLSSFNSTICSVPSSGIVGASSYHPYYTSAADEDVESLPGVKQYGVNVGLWSGLFNGEKGGREEGSLHQRGAAADGFLAYEDGSSFRRGKYDNSSAGKHGMRLDCSDWLDDKHSTTFEENDKISCKIAGAPVYDSTTFLNGMTYSQSPCPVPVTNAYGNSKSKSYDRYIAQLESCSTSPMIYYPSRTCSTSTQEHSSSNKCLDTSGYITMPAFNSYSKQHAKICEIKDEDNVSAEPSHLVGSRDAEVRQGNAVKSRASSNMNDKNGVVESSPMKIDLSFGNDFPNGNSMKCSTDVESVIRVKHVNILNSSGCDPAKDDNCGQTISGTLDQLHLAVDSPCWKGASASRQSPFSVGEMTDSLIVIEDSKVSVDFDQGQKHLPLGAKAETVSSTEQDGNLICSEYGKDTSLAFLRAPIQDFSLPSTHQKCGDETRTGQVCTKVDNKEKSNCSNILDERNSEDQSSKKDSESRDSDLKLGQEGNVVSANRHVLTSEISSIEIGDKNAGQDCSSDFNLFVRADPTHSSVSEVAVPCDIVGPLGSCDLSGRCSPSKIDAQLLVKAIHSLSEVLLSTHSVDATEIKEGVRELIQSAIQNLRASITESKEGISKACSHISGPEAGDVSALGADNVNQNKNKATHELKATHNIQNTLCLDGGKLDKFHPEGNDAEFRTSGMAQVLERALKESSLDQEEDSQALLYKNLWFKAEVALCSMKYELQLTHMKQKMGTCGQQARENSQESLLAAAKLTEESNGPSCETKVSLCNDRSATVDDADKSSCTKLKNKVPPSKTYKTDEIDDSVMARFRILKGRINSSSSVNVEETKLAGSIDINSTTKGACSPCTGSKGTEGLKGSPNKPANLSSIEGENQHSHTPDKARDRGFEVMERYVRQKHGANYSEEVGLGLGLSGQAAGVFLAGGPLVQSYMPKCYEKQYAPGGSESSSSEWEHVQAEELKW